jgi:hypothetical protein
MLVLVVAAGGWWRIHGGSTAVAGKSPAALVPSKPGAELPSSPVAPTSPGSSRASTPDRPVLVDREERERLARLRAAVWHAFGPAVPLEEAPRPSAEQDYLLPFAPPIQRTPAGRPEREGIRDRMHADFIPMAGGCYREAQGRLPGLTGSVVLSFTIVGDAKVGGIVDSAAILDRSTIRDAKMVECMRESMLTMTFPPPPPGGELPVEYPIDFDPDEDG